MVFVIKLFYFRSKSPRPGQRERSTSNRRSSLEKPTEVNTRRRSSLDKGKAVVKPVSKPVPEILASSKDE